MALDASSPIRLTELVSCGGCAAKFSAGMLQSLVGTLAPDMDADLLVGLAPSDDAAVYQLDDERAVVFTVDFFPPIVDDPSTFGAIAATNAMSDVYAMGGKPLLALSVAVFPETLPLPALSAIIEGAQAKAREAGALLAGGHTLRGDEPLYGLAVVGTVASDAIWTKAGVRQGDALYLTKPLGTGLLVHAHKNHGLAGSELEPALEQMQTLNDRAAELVRPFGPHAVTDVTGFGLIGHAYEMAARSSVGIELEAGALPSLPRALDLAREGVRTGGDERNREYVGAALAVEGADDAELGLAFDPQTAGGLLVAIDPSRAVELEQAASAGRLFLARVGVANGPAGTVTLRSRGG
ncbi:MAG TPA: selenide, water dikinase SelD [Gaiellaceae bacterium]|nr:selenide, water dikinase SelD [Gaiellaceae bacterium]